MAAILEYAVFTGLLLSITACAVAIRFPPV